VRFSTRASRQILKLLPACGFVFATMLSAQKPTIFDVSEVVVGTQRVLTLYLFAVGRWSDADPHVGVMSTNIQCYKALGFCEVASAEWMGNQATLLADSFDILRWDTGEIIAVDSSPICVVNSLRADLATKRVTLSSADKGVARDPFCKGSEKIPTSVLLDAYTTKVP
jgi:hypothetical protein